MATSVPVINAQLDTLNEEMQKSNYLRAKIAGKMGAFESIAEWAEFQAMTRLGLIHLYVVEGESCNVSTSLVVNAVTSGTGITAASVTKDTFLEVAGTTHHTYEFT